MPGNQLWQAAATVGVARARQIEPRFPTDWAYRDVFCLPDGWYSDDFTGCVELADCEEVRHLGDQASYAQDRSLWWPVADEIRRLFTFRQPATTPTFDVVVHVRRGDNAYDPGVAEKWRYHPLRPLDYYRQAIDRLRPFDTWAVYGDDPEWNRQYLPGADFYGDGRVRVKENGPAYDLDIPVDWQDLQAMTRCRAMVISNSTFAFWAAFLSGASRVVYPRPWYGPLLAHVDASLMFPEGWERVAHRIGPAETVAEWDRATLDRERDLRP